MNLFFIITISFPIANGTGTATQTNHGTYTPRQGETRQDVYQTIFKILCDKHGSNDLHVMFFSLERDELSAA